MSCNTDCKKNDYRCEYTATIDYKTEILSKICYTELVYERINKKLNKQLSRNKIEELILEIIKNTDKREFRKTGKNIYITNREKKIRLTINSNNYRIITVDLVWRESATRVSNLNNL